VQGRRDRERRQYAIEHVAISFFAQQTALQDALGQFLDKQWYAIGAVGDLVDDLIRQRFAAGNLLDQDGPVMPVQAIERQHRHLWLAGPGWLKLGAERHDQQHWQAADSLDGEVEQLERGRVDPVRVLEDHQHWLLVRQTFELTQQRLQCSFLLAPRAEVRQ